MGKTTTICQMVLFAACPLAGLEAVALQPDEDVVMQALAAELERSMTLQLEDLQSPYFVQCAVDDRESYRISATCGAIVTSDDGRSRNLAADIRVGSYDFDSTNFAGGGGGGFGGRGRRGGGGVTALPIEDSYSAIRQATWLATDSAYKTAVETFARKQAYMEDRSLQDRPDDFARAEPVVSIDPRTALTFDVDAWERRLRVISARFLEHPHVLDSSVTLTASADNRYLINSEGTRIRKGVAGVVLTISAQTQAEDGEQLSDRITHHAATADGLPGEAELLAEINAMAERLAGRARAPALEDYIGPVLFDGRAAPQLFQVVLARGVAGRPEPLGGERRRFAGLQSLDKYLGKRILPRSFQVYDDPQAASSGEMYLAGHYAIDDEGTPAQRVDIVVDGRLKGMVMSRVPTREFAASNGHGRSAGLGRTRVAVGCLFVEAADGVSDEELKQALIEAARDQGLEYGLRIDSISGGGGGRQMGPRPGRRAPGRFQFGGRGEAESPLGDPVTVYKVYLDGREEPVRGCEFGSLDVATLKDIIAAGDKPILYNTGSATGAATSIVAPAVLFEELELFTIEEDRQKLPILEAPHQRTNTGG
ncbi:MAG TPA: metallopeptidase TldD-related protein [Phycisphaerae bacterium]|nr:metallopeptidase TldD-related protein [Phycisphaerae bacterium]